MCQLKTLLFALLIGPALPALAAGIPAKLYRNPNCGCCLEYAKYLKSNGFDVEVIDTTDLSSIKRKYAVPEKLEGCHTATIGGYVFEGLIPADHIKRVLNERPPIKGLSLPGMPVGAPGMPGNKPGPLYIYYITDTPSPKVFASF